jgi:acyl-CoA thioesterase
MITPDDAARELAQRVAHRMMERDAFSQWLGIEIEAIGPESCRCRMTVRDEMLNGFGVAHGGIVFSLADSAFAFACNTHGRVTVSIENAVTYPHPVRSGDVLTAEATQEAASNRLGYYAVGVHNQEGALVAMFRGTAYKTSRLHFPDDT